MEKSRIQDLVIGVIVCAIGIWGWVLTGAMPVDTQMYTHVALFAFIVCGFALIVWSIVKRKVPAGEVIAAKTFGNPAIAFAMIVVYGVLMDKIGFFVSSAVFMPTMMVFMGYRKPLKMALTTIGMLLFIYLLFVWELKVYLPSGILF